MVMASPLRVGSQMLSGVNRIKNISLNVQLKKVYTVEELKTLILLSKIGMRVRGTVS